MNKPEQKRDKPSLLILSYTDSRREPRVWRQLCFLKDEYNITVTSVSDPNIDGVEWIPVMPMPLSLEQRLLRVAWTFLNSSVLGNYLSVMKKYSPMNISDVVGNFDLVLCHDQHQLCWAFSPSKVGNVVFEAHEYYPCQFENSLRWRILFGRYNKWVCENYIPKCAAMITVSDGIANEYRKNFGANPTVVHSAPDLEELYPHDVSEKNIKLIHHGAATSNRKIETMIDMMQYLDERFTLDLMLVGSGAYYDSLKRKALNTPRVNWLAPVPMQEIAKKCNDYDIGIFLVPPTTFNLKYCLPNKFFEFIQSRLAIAIAPSVEMAKIVKEHDLGVIAKDFTPQAMAASLNSLSSEDIARFKQNSDKAAKIYNSANEMETLKSVLKEVLKGR